MSRAGPYTPWLFTTMPEPLVSLTQSKPIIICPLETFKSIYLFRNLRFGPIDRDGSEKRHICCVCEDSPPALIRPKTPILFDVLGQIAVEDCFLTARGCPRPANEEPVASCWLQQRPNIVSDLKWRGIIPVIEAIVEEYAVGSEVDTSRLLTVGPDGKLRLQVIWHGEVGEFGLQLPIFDELGTEQVPESISQVPFGVPVHAVFSIEFVHDRRAGTRTVFASLFAMLKA
ncbi:hypothetical protein GSI_04264 [Ganoderma sinense ZZ0214-1]|uniref:Uncharacterized protein n=1 Tax=Ganoderma sinense ZZ0214-1 TaxID=1077348 RepID=A0A2G8SIQ2_9APHY|nr:hypothetical protein GSI_04264 [Ganoderma sinense ZZ0214-1]